MNWASAAGQKGNVINLRKLPCFSAGLFSRFGSSKKKKKTSSLFLTVQFKRKPITFFLFFLFLQPFGKWEDHLRQCFLGSYASLACPEIRSRGAAGNRGEASPSTMYHHLCFSHAHTQTHRLTRFSSATICSGKCRSATLLVQIQSNLNTKKAKSYSMIGAKYKNRITELN